ncbi:MAG: sigma-70 family RNA polymerase sigma factor [Cyclobacteriaceae bacterium]|nr:sigma-70 family RNA polymerase sigma factor [Cyclobacteriaceae bacterium SS2]
MEILLQQPSYKDKDSHSEKKRNNSSDKLLWNSFKEGSRKSFHYIYDQNFEKLLRYGLQFSSDQALVEDQIHELFIYLWKRKEHLDIQGSITVYLFWSLRNRIIKYMKAYREVAIDNDKELIESDEPFFDEHKYESLSKALQSLPPKQREVLTLRYFQNLDGEEIASIMNITIGATYNLISRAIMNLKSKISIFMMLVALLSYIVLR